MPLFELETAKSISSTSSNGADGSASNEKSHQSCTKKNEAGDYSNTNESNAVERAAESYFQGKVDEYLCPCFPDKEYLQIKVPLILLKLSLFLFYASIYTLLAYMNVYFIQLGISLSQLSFILFLRYLLLFTGSTLSGIVSDKLGKSKPVLITNLVLLGLVMNSLIFVPPINHKRCYIGKIEIACVPESSIQDNGVRVNTQAKCFTHCFFEQHSYSYFEVAGNRTKENSVKENGTFSIPENLFRVFNETKVVKFPRNTTLIDSVTFCHFVNNDNCTTFCRMDYELEENWQKPTCPEMKENANFVFCISLIISLLVAALVAGCTSLLEVMSASMAKKYGSDYGRERFWSILGIGTMAPLAGYLVDLTTPDGAPRNYRFVFYFIDSGLVLLLAALYKLEVQINPPGRKMWRKAVRLIKNMDIMVFALSVLVSGMGWGFTKSFAFIYLDQLGSPSVLLGLLLTVNSISGLPFLLTSDWWVKTFGSPNLMVLGLFGYVCLSIGYSILVNPWYALICETFSIFTYHLLWVSVIRHCHDIAPAGLSATVTACAFNLQFSLGSSIGNLIGGLVMSKFGGRWSFRLVALICGATAVVYGTYTFFRSRRTEKTKCKSHQ